MRCQGANTVWELAELALSDNTLPGMLSQSSSTGLQFALTRTTSININPSQPCLAFDLYDRGQTSSRGVLHM